MPCMPVKGTLACWGIKIYMGGCPYLEKLPKPQTRYGFALRVVPVLSQNLQL